MNIKISKNIFFKVIVLLLCIYIGFAPFFQPKKVQASPFLLGITALLTTGMIAGRYVQTNVLYTPEQMNRINEQWTANLQTAFPDPDDYNHQMNALQNLNQKLLNGEEVNWSKYSGKALYAVLKGVVDVVWPYSGTGTAIPNSKYIGTANGFEVYVTSGLESGFPALSDVSYKYVGVHVLYRKSIGNGVKKDSFKIYAHNLSTLANASYDGVFYNYNNELRWQTKDMYPVSASDAIVYAFGFIPEGKATENVQKVPNMTAKTANKVKLPTRLPQTVINNINNYIDGSTENLIVNPTPDELPQLPEGYNPVTDDLPDLPGYVDVTPDQQPTTDPEPTPTPPEYDGSGWVNPIGNFLAGLLEFLKTAFVPTQSLDFSPLQNMESGTFGAKFPFSLPSDFGKILGVIQADPITPKFDASIPLSKVGYQDIPMEIDLEPYSNIAGICKSGFVILFCIGLFFLTRRFMSPGG